MMNSAYLVSSMSIASGAGAAGAFLDAKWGKGKDYSSRLIVVALQVIPMLVFAILGAAGSYGFKLAGTALVAAAGGAWLYGERSAEVAVKGFNVIFSALTAISAAVYLAQPIGFVFVAVNLACMIPQLNAGRLIAGETPLYRA